MMVFQQWACHPTSVVSGGLPVLYGVDQRQLTLLLAQISGVQTDKLQPITNDACIKTFRHSKCRSQRFFLVFSSLPQRCVHAYREPIFQQSDIGTLPYRFPCRSLALLLGSKSTPLQACSHMGVVNGLSAVPQLSNQRRALFKACFIINS